MVESDRRLRLGNLRYLQIDLLLAAGGAVASAIVGVYLMASMRQYLYGFSSLMVCMGCLIYILIRKHLGEATKLHRANYDALWLLLYFGALLAYAFRPSQYERPLAFFILIALSCGVLAAKALFCRLSKWGMYLTIAAGDGSGFNPDMDGNVDVPDGRWHGHLDASGKYRKYRQRGKVGVDCVSGNVLFRCRGYGGYPSSIQAGGDVGFFFADMRRRHGPVLNRQAAY